MKELRDKPTPHHAMNGSYLPAAGMGGIHVPLSRAGTWPNTLVIRSPEDARQARRRANVQIFLTFAASRVNHEFSCRACSADTASLERG